MQMRMLWQLCNLHWSVHGLFAYKTALFRKILETALADASSMVEKVFPLKIDL